MALSEGEFDRMQVDLSILSISFFLFLVTQQWQQIFYLFIYC